MYHGMIRQTKKCGRVARKKGGIYETPSRPDQEAFDL
jgi:hypothetical protein